MSKEDHSQHQLDSPLQPSSASEKQGKPFKNKSKHNLALFGAKLSSTAASVGVHTSKYKQQKEKEKEQQRESVIIDTPEPSIFEHQKLIGSPLTPRWPQEGSGDITPSSLSAPSSATTTGGLKSKMFKQSKTDLKSLKIKTDLSIHVARTSLNDRSPMTRGTSNKELDRIAALGQQPNSPVHQGEFNFGHSSNSGHYHLPPHLSFRKRDSPAAVLSSSASNSTLASEGTVYSFNQANGNASSSVHTAHHSFKTQEEATAFLTSSWTLLTQRIQPVFKKDEFLRIPVEDVNILVFMHFTAHHEQGKTGVELLNKIEELLQTGFSSLVPLQPTLEKLAESWKFFYGKTLLSLEAIFLPLQLELDGMGQVFTSSKSASEYWFPLNNHRSSAFNKTNASKRKLQRPNIRRKVLTVYRDLAVLPILNEVDKLLVEGDMQPETMAYLLQCFTALSNLKTQGDAQTSIENTLSLLTKNVKRSIR